MLKKNIRTKMAFRTEVSHNHVHVRCRREPPLILPLYVDDTDINV